MDPPSSISASQRVIKQQSGTAIPHRFAPQAGWVSFRMEKAEDLDSAKKLIKLAYDDAKASMEGHRTRRSQMKLG